MKPPYPSHGALMATSRDVAERAGVSRATVSAVLNGTRYVSPELRQRIEQAIAELDYRPNVLARSLKTNRSYTVGVVFPTLYSPFYAALISAVEKTLAWAGYSLILASSNDSPDRESEVLGLMAQKQVDGILLIACSPDSASLVMDLIHRDIPVVLLDRCIPGLDVDTVVSDNEKGGYIATEHLIEAGCRRIGLITFSKLASSSLLRELGYRAAMAQHHLPVYENLIANVADTEGEGAYAAALRLLTTSEPPDGLVLFSQRVTATALAALQERGIRVPEDVKVVGFDDSPWAPILYPPLTVVDQQVMAMGQRAAEILLSRLDEPGPAPAEQVVLEMRLIPRSSSGGVHVLVGDTANASE